MKNAKPISYLQTDSKWANISYSVKGENTTIGKSGCGPTSASMLLATLTGNTSINPKTECAWALANGYKALKSGTYYGYFVPAFKRYGITCTMLNSSNIYGNSTSQYHAKAKVEIDKGNYVIACMGKGNWTSSGHYIVVYGIEGDVVYINDPASTKLQRTQGSYSLFKQQVKYYWVIQTPQKKKQEEEDIVTQSQFEQMYATMRAKYQDNDASDYSEEARKWIQEAEIVKGGKDGQFNGMWEDTLTREQMAVILYRFYEYIKNH